MILYGILFFAFWVESVR